MIINGATEAEEDGKRAKQTQLVSTDIVITCINGIKIGGGTEVATYRYALFTLKLGYIY